MFGKKSPIKEEQRKSGFALISTLSIIVLLAFIAAALLSLSSLSLRQSSHTREYEEARENAKLGLMIALNDLQGALGPDQRVTAQADIKNRNPAAPVTANGHSRWCGVWDTTDFNPTAPSIKTFNRWLVSGTPAQKSALITTNSAKANTVTLHNALDSSGGGDPLNSVSVPLVSVSDSSNQISGAYAYWIEDEGVKADLRWHEEEFALSGGKPDRLKVNSHRYSVVSGGDAGVFIDPSIVTNPIRGLSYPLSIQNNAQPYLKDLQKAGSLNDLALAYNAPPSDFTNWLQRYRHDVTLGSKNVLCDVKKGGLKRDLSLAFEMDGIADYGSLQDGTLINDPPTLFNSEVGEFVGGTDGLEAPKSPLNIPETERFVYRVSPSSTVEPYNSIKGDLQRKIAPYTSVVRGPSWWAIRDYYNLYKRLGTSGSIFEMEARPYFPNYTSINDNRYTLGEMMGKNAGDGIADEFGVRIGTNAWDHEYNNGIARRVADDYIYKPMRANYAPVFLGMVQFLSVTTVEEGGEYYLALGIDPVVYFWNPFDVAINVDALAVSFQFGTAGNVTLWKDDTAYGPNVVKNYLAAMSSSSSTKISGNQQTLLFNNPNFTMQPGEVVIMSPSSSRSTDANMLHDELFLGLQIDNESGIIADKIPVTTNSWQRIKIDINSPTEKIKFNYNNNIARVNANFKEVHFRMNYNMPPASRVAKDLTNKNFLGDEVQSLGNKTDAVNEPPEYFDPPISDDPMVEVPDDLGEVRSSDLWAGGQNIKHFFSIRTFMAKPANYTGNNPNPVEVFSHFNPMPPSTTLELNRLCMLNQVTNSISVDTSDPDTLKSLAHIEFPATVGKGFWGESLNSGTQEFIFASIPKRPMLSLADFTHANLAMLASEPYKAVGNSWASLFVPKNAVLGLLDGNLVKQRGVYNIIRNTAADRSWLINDALFDRYFFSGIAPPYTMGNTTTNAGGRKYGYKASSGSSASDGIAETLKRFYGITTTGSGGNAIYPETSPALSPYIPEGITAPDIVTNLTPSTGKSDVYKKLGAYAFLDGGFNINSTSIKAWEALLRANRSLETISQNGSTKTNPDETAFPSSQTPPDLGQSGDWDGYKSLTDTQITALATSIVTEVRERGPFMSISDFVNREISTTDNAHMGALQEAIETTQLNDDVRRRAGGVDPVYSYDSTDYYEDAVLPSNSNPSTGPNRKTTTGLPSEITQADLLRPLAPKISARSDTFKIRAYGESTGADAKAYCEAVVQRLPEYFNAEANDPWDDNMPTSSRSLSPLNNMLGRRFKIISFRWLNASEI